MYTDHDRIFTTSRCFISLVAILIIIVALAGNSSAIPYTRVHLIFSLAFWGAVIASISAVIYMISLYYINYNNAPKFLKKSAQNKSPKENDEIFLNLEYDLDYKFKILLLVFTGLIVSSVVFYDELNAASYAKTNLQLASLNEFHIVNDSLEIKLNRKIWDQEFTYTLNLPKRSPRNFLFSSLRHYLEENEIDKLTINYNNTADSSKLIINFDSVDDIDHIGLFLTKSMLLEGIFFELYEISDNGWK